jgi:hypothetical protein
MTKDQERATQRYRNAQARLAAAEKIGNPFAIAWHEAELAHARADYERAGQ